MIRLPQIFAAAATATATLVLLATAQEGNQTPPDPDFSKVPEKPSAESLAAREAGIRTAWTNALNVAHQIAASQGYRSRDSRWTGELATEGFTIIPLQLYAGNDYFIVLGSDCEEDTISAAAFDPEQRLIKTPPDSAPGKLVFHLTPKKSGAHYLRLQQKAKRAQPTRCALTYVYR
ncbi:MAG: hypothetical protein ACI8XO_001844 [Verrucomicrobiales bacterium]|jgi:hypothetical protein